MYETAGRRRIAGRRPRDAVWERTLGGAVLRANGERDSALTLFRSAAALDESLPFQYGPPITAKPPRELAGELLLELGRPADAGVFGLAGVRAPHPP